MGKNILTVKKIPMICDSKSMLKPILSTLTGAGIVRAAGREIPVCKVLKYDSPGRVFSSDRQPIKSLRQNDYDEANEGYWLRGSTFIISNKWLCPNNKES